MVPAVGGVDKRRVRRRTIRKKITLRPRGVPHRLSDASGTVRRGGERGGGRAPTSGASLGRVDWDGTRARDRRRGRGRPRCLAEAAAAEDAGGTRRAVARSAVTIVLARAPRAVRQQERPERPGRPLRALAVPPLRSALGAAVRAESSKHREALRTRKSLSRRASVAARCSCDNFCLPTPTTTPDGAAGGQRGILALHADSTRGTRLHPGADRNGRRRTTSSGTRRRRMLAHGHHARLHAHVLGQEDRSPTGVGPEDSRSQYLPQRPVPAGRQDPNRYVGCMWAVAGFTTGGRSGRGRKVPHMNSARVQAEV